MVWNCNGDLWTHPERLEEVTRGRDIILLTETHESPERSLPRIQDFQWESAHRRCMRQNTSRGSGGVAILFHRELQHTIQIEARDPEARFLWIRIELSADQIIYIALCYFAPTSSRFAVRQDRRRRRMGSHPTLALQRGSWSTLHAVNFS